MADLGHLGHSLNAFEWQFPVIKRPFKFREADHRVRAQ
jgi:hypothetical protein